MSLQRFDWYSWLVVFVLVLSLSLLVVCICSPSFGVTSSCSSGLTWGIFCFDGVSVYLVVLSLFLWFSLAFFSNWVSTTCKLYVSFSVVFSLLSYCCSHALFFWVFYELAILPLLLLLVLESPYSERYIASWYLLGYVVVTSLPMLVGLFFLSVEMGSYNMMCWSLSTSVEWGVVCLLGVLFVTKIPLPPFHVWLPIVHAEASSAVSVCLSGYVMKLGLLGVCRFCFWCLPDLIFSSVYVLVGLIAGVLFFLSAVRELDGKRWLAFLSLSHIVIAAVILSVANWDVSGVCFLFCLGHGLSAAVIFVLLWIVYEVSGTRNWSLLKTSLAGGLLFRSLCAASLCSAGSLPPTVQFFSEVLVIGESVFISLLFIFVFFVYMFLSGLVPLFLLGTLVTRHLSVSFGVGHIVGVLSSVAFLVVWSFVLFVVC